MEIPYQKLSEDALKGVIDDFIFREGTDYGHEDFTYEEKFKQVLAKVTSGDVRIYFDPKTESCTLRES